MATDDFPLINDPHAPPPHAPPRHADAESINGEGGFYASYADSDPEKSGSVALTTPSSKRHQNLYYHNNKMQKLNGESESKINTNAAGAAAEYRADYRKDREEWSETAISCLLEAYTEKYNQLNRGNLRGRDWEEVAEEVGERGGGNNRKSVEQCKNKIDNLKKRYKVELQRINNGGSTWHWFKQIEAIMGNSSNNVIKAGDSKCGSGNGSLLAATRPIKR